MAKVKEQIDIQTGEHNIVALYYADDVEGYGFEFIDWNTGDYSMDFVFGTGEDVEQLCYQVFRMFCELIEKNATVTLNALRDFKDALASSTDLQTFKEVFIHGKQVEATQRGRQGVRRHERLPEV